MEDHPRYACLCFVGGSDDVLSKVLATLIEFKALLPALMMMSNPFQSASSLTSKQAEAQAYDFKARLLHYTFQYHRHLGCSCLNCKLTRNGTVWSPGST